MIGYAVAGAGALGILLMIAAAVRSKPIVQGPRGQMAMFDQGDADYFAWFTENARTSDRMFGDPQVNFLLGFRNPSKIEWVEPENYTPPDQVADLVNTLDKVPTRFILWADDLDQYHGPGDNLQPLRAFLKSRYQTARHYDDGSKILMLISPIQTRP